jgi:hypothetical protein
MLARKWWLTDNCGTQGVAVIVAVTHVNATRVGRARGACAGSLVACHCAVWLADREQVRRADVVGLQPGVSEPEDQAGQLATPAWTRQPEASTDTKASYGILMAPREHPACAR